MNFTQIKLPIQDTLDNKTTHIQWLANMEYIVMLLVLMLLFDLFCADKYTFIIILDK